jgi:hypothetical protein
MLRSPNAHKSESLLRTPSRNRNNHLWSSTKHYLTSSIGIKIAARFAKPAETNIIRCNASLQDETSPQWLQTHHSRPWQANEAINPDIRTWPPQDTLALISREHWTAAAATSEPCTWMNEELHAQPVNSLLLQEAANRALHTSDPHTMVIMGSFHARAQNSIGRLLSRRQRTIIPCLHMYGC